MGIEGDACDHPGIHGGPQKALLILTAEGIDELILKGYPLFHGALGENLTTRGLDRRGLRIGQQFRVGEAVVELTTIRAPCATIEIYGAAIGRQVYDRQVKAGDFSSPRWGLSGFYASVVRPGMVRVNDVIALQSVLA